MQSCTAPPRLQLEIDDAGGFELRESPSSRGSDYAPHWSVGAAAHHDVSVDQWGRGSAPHLGDGQEPVLSPAVDVSLSNYALYSKPPKVRWNQKDAVYFFVHASRRPGLGTLEGLEGGELPVIGAKLNL